MTSCTEDTDEEMLSSLLCVSGVEVESVRKDPKTKGNVLVFGIHFESISRLTRWTVLMYVFKALVLIF